MQYISKRRLRPHFNKILDTSNIPSLIKLQKKSYKGFMQPYGIIRRKNLGLESIFYRFLNKYYREKKIYVKYMNYEILPSFYSPHECSKKGITYGCLIKAILKSSFYGKNNKIANCKNQEIIVSELPLMTSNGTFIINGIERVVVSQLHKSPGIFYTANTNNQQNVYIARIIPYYGNWIDIELRDGIDIKIDKKKKIPMSTFLKSLGLKNTSLYSYFYSKSLVLFKNSLILKEIDLSNIKNKAFNKNIINISKSNIMIKNEKIESLTYTNNIIKYPSCYYQISRINLSDSYYITSREYKFLSNKSIPILEVLYFLKNKKIIYIYSLVADHKYIENTIKNDFTTCIRDSLLELHKSVSPRDPFTPKNTINFIYSIFSENNMYDLSTSGRLKLNYKNYFRPFNNNKFINAVDILSIVKHLIKIKKNNLRLEDVNSLANRRLKTTGELINSNFYISFIKIDRNILEKLNCLDIDHIVSPVDFISTNGINISLRDFFCTSQLSQFMDQTNPLAEITHKRRLSSLGSGGLTKDRANFEARDIHYTHYNRICPVETPEGHNIGLISSLPIYSNLDKCGFISTPYRKVCRHIVTNKVIYLTAIEEDLCSVNISGSNLHISKTNTILNDLVLCNNKGMIANKIARDVMLLNISSTQMISIASSLIPFLENNDANRALMGSNMQRQAVPLMKSESPIIGTGTESIVSRDSEVVIVSENGGRVIFVDSAQIIIEIMSLRYKNLGIDIHNLIKFNKSNQGTCINQKPLVLPNDIIKKSHLIADGTSTDAGELSLGKNVLVAFMSWDGYNFEDSIVLSSRSILNDTFSSLHIEEYEISVKDNRGGREEITRDVPGIDDYHLRNLDENGIALIGSRLFPKDIIVGKVSPKSTSPSTSEEKLLRSVFGEKASEVKNLSLKTLKSGVVIGVRIFNKKSNVKDERISSIESEMIKRYVSEKNCILSIMRNYIIFIALKKVFFSVRNFHLLNKMILLKMFYDDYLQDLDTSFDQNFCKSKYISDLSYGVAKIIKLYVISKLRIKVGDKMSGRHGNKGVISKILPVEDMPFTNDGRILDIILNPLGVPSRMNIGQIFETHLGWISEFISYNIKRILNDSVMNMLEIKKIIIEVLSIQNSYLQSITDFILKLHKKNLLVLIRDLLHGIKIALHSFNKREKRIIDRFLLRSKINNCCQSFLRDGRTGIFFERKITVGYIYMMKLDHLVGGKLHSRSVGPYSLITQQPLGGKSHFGGQRVGEMECWALQAYGAAYTLKEMLTIKSDDVVGRINAYESIIRGSNTFESLLPESFKVMVKEMKSLCLNIQIKKLNLINE